MAKTGRPRKPTGKHKLVGSYRPDRHGKGEPAAPAGDAKCPGWVIGDARQHWDTILPMLEGMGVMSPAFSPALGLLVNSLGRYIEYEQKMTDCGPVSVTDKGNEIVSPWWSARNKAWEQVLKGLREFGLSPAAITSVRPSVGGEESEDNDSMETILKLASAHG